MKDEKKERRETERRETDRDRYIDRSVLIKYIYYERQFNAGILSGGTKCEI